MAYVAHRPQGHHGQGDSRLASNVRQLRRMLLEVQRGFTYDNRSLDHGCFYKPCLYGPCLPIR